MYSSPQVQIGTLAPPDYSFSVPEALLEEQQEEEDEEEEIHLRPQLIPQGSGGSGVLMGPDTQKGLENTQFGYLLPPNFLIFKLWDNRIKAPLVKVFWNNFGIFSKVICNYNFNVHVYHLTSR